MPEGQKPSGTFSSNTMYSEQNDQINEQRKLYSLVWRLGLFMVLVTILFVIPACILAIYFFIDIYSTVWEFRSEIEKIMGR